MKNTAEQILDAIKAGFAAGGKDEWDAPEFQAARDLTEAAGCVWDFAGWRDTAYTIRAHGMLGDVVLHRWIVGTEAGDGLNHKTFDSLEEAKAAVERACGDGYWYEENMPGDARNQWLYSDGGETLAEIQEV